MMRGEGLAGAAGRDGPVPGGGPADVRRGREHRQPRRPAAAAANYLDRELDYKIKRFTTLIEPAVIIAVGVIVGFVAIALVSAMYGIFHQVKVT